VCVIDRNHIDSALSEKPPHTLTLDLSIVVRDGPLAGALPPRRAAGDSGQATGCGLRLALQRAAQPRGVGRRRQRCRQRRLRRLAAARGGGLGTDT